MSSFAKKLRASQDSHIYVVQGFDYTGQHAWYFVKVPAAQAAFFDAAIARGELMNLSEAGEILISGYGASPPPEAYAQAGCNLPA